MFVLPLTSQKQDLAHFPLVFDYELFDSDIISFDDLHPLYKAYLLSFTFLKSFVSSYTLSIQISDWVIVNEKFNDWVFYNLVIDSFYTEEIETIQVLTSLFNWRDVCVFMESIFNKLQFSFAGIDNWVEANYIFKDWENYNLFEKYYFLYTSYKFFENLFDKYLTTAGLFFFVYLDKFDCKLLEEILQVIPKEILLASYQDKLSDFVAIFNANLAQKYGTIEIDLGQLQDKKKKFIQFIITVLVKSFSKSYFIDTGYSLAEGLLSRNCIDNEWVGFSMEPFFKYNEYIKLEK